MSVLYVVKKQNQFKALAELYLLQVSCEHVMSKSGILFLFHIKPSKPYNTGNNQLTELMRSFSFKWYTSGGRVGREA